MPLHDWSDLAGWDGVHHIWIVELLYWIKPRLPEGYRAFIGTTPTFVIDAPIEDRPDVGVHGSAPPAPAPGPDAESLADEPDQEIAVAAIESNSALFIERKGHLIAAVELVSPRNKDRDSAQVKYALGYTAYILKGVHLLLVDVHRRPLRFSFADQIAKELQIDQPPCPPPFAASYRVGEPAPQGGHFLATWRRPLEFGAALPPMRLHLSVHESVPIDLEHTYARAAEAAYLS
jgi:hypothetical protein